jgi:hypothetical protein
VVESNGNVWTLPPTSAEIARTCYVDKVVGASLDVSVWVPDHPFGTRHRRLRFIDGLIQIATTFSAEPDLEIWLPFDSAAGFLLGGIAFRTIAGQARVRGELYALGCLAGLLAPGNVLERWSATHASAAHACLALRALEAVRDQLGPLRSHSIEV